MKRKIIVVGLGLVLTACGYVGHNGAVSPASTQMAHNGAQSQGLGQQAKISGKNINNEQVARREIYHFDFDRTVLKGNDIAHIEKQARYLAAHPNARIVLFGHTDERGSREYNVGLGENRAKSVANLLRLDGVRPLQIRVVSFGKEKPTAFAHNESAYRLNRRVELRYEDRA